MKTVYTIYSDPGHAWCKVERKELEELGILHQISSCSYQKDNYVYLEEDSDLSTFIQAKKNKGVSTLFFRERVATERYSRIRKYKSFRV